MNIGDVNVLHGPLSRRILPLTVALFLSVALIVGLTWGALELQITLAGFLNGESVWSKAQKDAVISVLAYSETANPADLDAFKEAFDVLENDRVARDSLVAGEYDQDKITAAFRRGNIMTEAQPGMVFALVHFNHMNPIREAVDVWSASDQHIQQLNVIAGRLEKAYSNPKPPSQRWLLEQRDQIWTINRTVRPLAERFSIVVARGTATVGNLLFFTMLIAAVLAIAFLMFILRRTLKSIRAGEQRFQGLFEHAADGIFMIDVASGNIIYLNTIAASWLDATQAEVIGSPISGYLETVSPSDQSARHQLKSKGGTGRSVEIQSSIVEWDGRPIRHDIVRDISERLTLERNLRMQAEALASIAEGVLIADATGAIIHANDASFRITGRAEKRLIGKSILAYRTMPDGNALPESIWNTIKETGNWQGEVHSRRSDGRLYPEQLSISAVRSEMGNIQFFVAVFSNISAQKANQLRLEQLAAHDPLTGLINRAEFERQCATALEAAAKARMALAVLFIDLDGFKSVNDSLAHVVGDQLLTAVADRIRRQLDRGVASRLGGDEFTVLLPGLATREDACAFAGRLLSSLAEPFMILDHAIMVTASIGVAGYPLDGTTPGALIANADAAMYAAKTSERNSYRLYSPTMHAAVHERLTLSNELRQAMMRDEFFVVYQPIRDLTTEKVTGVEALLRWNRGSRAPLNPDEFIPFAETMGISRRIDLWVLETVLEDIAQWERRGIPPIRVAVNVSASTFANPMFVENVTRMLHDFSVAPARLLIEITESAMLKVGDETDSTLRSLAELGVTVAIDDFGTGYSSLSYLKLPSVTYVKIDRTFVAGIPTKENDNAITRAIIAVAKNLGLQTIAEGIETAEQHEFLRNAGCNEAQGFHYAMPMHSEKLIELLSSVPRSSPAVLRIVE